VPRVHGGWIDLGKLKGNIGIHNSVTIWCKPFNVIFGVAVLQGAD